MGSRWVIAAVAALALVLATAGCTGDTGTADTKADGSGTLETQDADTGDAGGTSGEAEGDALLTPADVEKVSGLTGLKVVPYDPSVGAGGTINIAKADGQLVAMLSDQGPDTWEAWSKDGITFREPYTPVVGDESFVGPVAKTSPALYIFAFRKGDRAIVIDTYFDPAAGTTILTVDQLHQLAVVVESRL